MILDVIAFAAEFADAGTEYAADLIAFLVRTNPADPGPCPEVILAMTKRRGGPICNTPLKFNMPKGRFERGGV